MQHTWLIPEVSDPVPRGRARTRRCGKIPAPLRDPHGDLYSNLNKVNNDFLRGAMRWAHPSRKRRPQHRLTPGPCCNAAGPDSDGNAKALLPARFLLVPGWGAGAGEDLEPGTFKPGLPAAAAAWSRVQAASGACALPTVGCSAGHSPDTPRRTTRPADGKTFRLRLTRTFQVKSRVLACVTCVSLRMTSHHSIFAMIEKIPFSQAVCTDMRAVMQALGLLLQRLGLDLPSHVAVSNLYYILNIFAKKKCYGDSPTQQIAANSRNE